MKVVLIVCKTFFKSIHMKQYLYHPITVNKVVCHSEIYDAITRLFTITKLFPIARLFKIIEWSTKRNSKVGYSNTALLCQQEFS